ncbi:hypothetical protein, partial [Salmonella enterica]
LFRSVVSTRTRSGVLLTWRRARQFVAAEKATALQQSQIAS